MLASLGRRIARPHLRKSTVRLRLTVVYGLLFLLCGAALLAVTYLLVGHATAGNFSYTTSDGRTVAGHVGGGSVPTSRSDQPSQQASIRNGGEDAKKLSPQQTAAVERELRALAAHQHEHLLHQLLVYSGIALAIMAGVATGLGWFVAGRVLRPLRVITATANDISATNLHERLALTGPKDELKRLGDTFDSLLARLEGAFDAQRRFVANASHELRTPLTVMKALLQMTLTDPDATIDSFRTTCREALAAGEQQERLIDALLVLAHSERGLDHREPFDLARTAGKVLTGVAPTADRLARRMETSLREAPVDGDARLAERLISNLLDNALRYNADRGFVELATGMRSGRCFVSVSNSGPVVPPEEIERLLRPFQRLGPDSTQHDDGLGLGLSIVQAIAAAHDATLSVRARAGGGLDIEVTFPPGQGAAGEPMAHRAGRELVASSG